VSRRLTVGEYLTEWLDGKRDLRPTTRRSYEMHLENVLIPHLGRIELAGLRRSHVEAMLENIDRGATTKQRIRATLRSALSDAEREGLIVVNAARLARLEPARRLPVRPLEPEELGRLLDHLASDPLGLLYEVIAMTGLRRGEALGLRWVDVDLDAGVLAVRRQVVQIQGRHDCEDCEGHNGLAFAEPKTTSGTRPVELDGHTVGVLMDQRLRQRGSRQLAGRLRRP
jgi:integrase